MSVCIQKKVSAIPITFCVVAQVDPKRVMNRTYYLEINVTILFVPF